MMTVDGYLLPKNDSTKQDIIIKKLKSVKNVIHSEEEMTYFEFTKRFKGGFDGNTTTF